MTDVSNRRLSELRADLVRIYAAAVAGVEPARLVERALTGESDADLPATLSRASRVRVLAVGKAATGMARATRRQLGSKVSATLVVTSRGSDHAEEGIAVMVGAHPLPDATSVAAGQAVLDFVRQAGDGELVLLLLSGGASALMAMPAPGIRLEDKIAVTQSLMQAGATIGELNTARKHLSMVKGGGLLRALGPGATIASLILSDVTGNDLATIGSGPAVPDPTTFADAIAVMKRRKIWGRTPEPVRDRLERGAAGTIVETVKRGDPVAARSISYIIGDNRTACAAAVATARAAGYAVESADDLSAPADLVCARLASSLSALDGRSCVVAGGEPLVRVRGGGRGGRAQHCALLLANELTRLAPDRPIAALFAGTDGIDGPTDAAGAIVTPATLRRAAEARLDPAEALARCDSYPFFQALGDLLIVGPTGTNVSDVFVGLVGTDKS